MHAQGNSEGNDIFHDSCKSLGDDYLFLTELEMKGDTDGS